MCSTKKTWKLKEIAKHEKSAIQKKYIERVQHEESATWKKWNTKRVQHGKSATSKYCNMNKDSDSEKLAKSYKRRVDCIPETDNSPSVKEPWYISKIYWFFYFCKTILAVFLRDDLCCTFCQVTLFRHFSMTPDPVGVWVFPFFF